TPSSFFIHSVSPATVCRIPVFRDLFFLLLLREFIFLMNLKLVRRSTLSTLPSASEYSETRLAPNKNREKGKRRGQKRKEKETETSRIWIWTSNTKRALSRIVGY